MSNITKIWEWLPPRFEHEFDCVGCGRSVIAFVHYGHLSYCMMCQELGGEMSKAIQDRGDSIHPVSK